MKIAFGIPVMESVPGEAFGQHLVTAIELGRLGTVAVFSPVNVMPHDRTRTMVMDGALEQDCDVLVFVDDDTLIPVGGIPTLLETLRSHKAAVVSGHYLRRGFPYTSVWSKKLGATWNQVDASEGIHEIDCSGLGCAVIDLDWVRGHLEPPYFGMLHDGRATVIGDDVTFFEKVRAKGGLVLGHAGVRCGHLGERMLITDQSASFLRKRELEILKSRGLA